MATKMFCDICDNEIKDYPDIGSHKRIAYVYLFEGITTRYETTTKVCCNSCTEKYVLLTKDFFNNPNKENKNE